MSNRAPAEELMRPPRSTLACSVPSRPVRVPTWSRRGCGGMRLQRRRPARSRAAKTRRFRETDESVHNRKRSWQTARTKRCRDWHRSPGSHQCAGLWGRSHYSMCKPVFWPTMPMASIKARAPCLIRSHLNYEQTVRCRA
eukprot:6212981-Pleurochrysis_carterae.AAC.2